MRTFAAFILALLFSAEAQDTKPSVTFTKDVAPILFANCTSCHRPGEVAPFTLLNYADAKKRGKQMVTVLENHQMPPWKPETSFGDFVGERRMKAEDIAVVKKWVDQGCAEGEAKDLPALPKYPEGWVHGEPDLIVKMTEPYMVPAEGRDVYRSFTI